jgi:hypothetical protein
MYALIDLYFEAENLSENLSDWYHVAMGAHMDYSCIANSITTSTLKFREQVASWV